MAKYYLGIDLGGTEVKMGVVDNAGKIMDEGRVYESASFSPEALVNKVIDSASCLKFYKNIAGVGIGVAGDIDQGKGVVRFSPNLPNWKNIRLRNIIEKRIKRRVIVDNDANAAAWGAYILEAKRNFMNVVCITLGTGVGGGLIINGKLYRGATGTAGEIGHIHLFPDGIKCNCGSYGCIERYLGISYLRNQGQELVSGAKSSIILNLAENNPGGITPKILEEAAKKGDIHARKIWEEYGRNLGIILADIINFLNPQAIILSGGISRAGSLFLHEAEATIDQRAFKTSAKACKILISKFTNRIGIVGAALLSK